jgi:hypothetical protein
LLMTFLRLLQASDADVRLLVLNTFQILVRHFFNILNSKTISSFL